MQYISAAQAASEWKLEPRSVQRFCKDKRIPGAVRFGREWLIPSDAKKPSDQRVPGNAEPEYLPYLLISGIFSVESEDISSFTDDPDMQKQFYAERCYLKGEMDFCMRYALDVPPDSKVYLCACMIGIYAAVNAGAYEVFDPLRQRLKDISESWPDVPAGRIADAALASVSISLSDLSNVPEWMAEGDLSALPPLLRPWAFYQHAKYQRATEHYEKAFTVASTTQQLIAKPGVTTLCDIYLLMACASASHYMGMEEDAEKYLLEALKPIARNRFITPLAETVTNYGSVIDKCLQKNAPELYDPIIRQSKTNWYNWMRFHNRFVEDRVTVILSLQELYLARLLADGVTYSEAAERMDLSIGRIRNLASSIYSKLQISGKAELKSFLLY